MSLEISTLYFPEWNVGNRKLRFLYLCSPISFKLCHKHQAEEYMIPLFLGADVVTQTGVRTENHPKVHAKFAKKGLATKLNFDHKFRFDRLRLPTGVNGLWFYSIQGVFQVAFTMYDKEEQLAVLESLQDLWKSRIKDDPLDQVYDLGNIQLWETTQRKSSSSNKSEVNEILYGLTSDVPHRNWTNSATVNMDRSGRQWIKIINSEHNYCLSNDVEYSLTDPDHFEGINENPIFQKIKSLLRISKTTFIDPVEQSKSLIIVLLDIIELLLMQRCPSVSNLTSLIPQFLDCVCRVSLEDNSSSSLYGNSLLYEISSWLGNRFFSENAAISVQVEEFKRKHIDHITDLPPAEELVTALFPEAMKVLLLNWMGLSESSAFQKLQSEYPILLLILEFANHNLITGVAHVLYSSLICK
uniref:Uncharacterized protein LOC117364716 n=1 Tax=Geotrypetes seraphini TaxID=260995 RepID=A0A6P8RWW1_GEOSA|nr:uncharacterized protein LOC117364716 [Geotrypetes seraphini]XP_033810134.1 uncharacterized protein LOC117364716 [Geotrypetes seraphini]XP_033810136.1 uncharacterized protein LOC117364716 [Geotrypetes seraphini]XP_033810137.1 uncharacterized protein LOC117364716 [Geotrypetes seraphini]